MTLVLDASLALSWYFEDERTAAADAVLDQVADESAIVPGLWRLEIANGFQSAIRRGRIDIAYRDQAIFHLTTMPIMVDSDTNAHAWTTTLRLSDRFRLTTYDAAYLELAQRRKLPLATLDRQLGKAGNDLGVRILGNE